MFEVFFCGGISSCISVLFSLITFAAARRRTLFKISFALSLSSVKDKEKEKEKKKKEKPLLPLPSTRRKK